jgi:hypothetical protein
MARSSALPILTAESGLTRYLEEIRRFPMLEPQQEYMLAKRWREHGDREAAHKLVTSHLRLVAKIAMGYRGYGLPIAEVISEGNVGLMQAVKRFEPEKGFRHLVDARLDQVIEIARHQVAFLHLRNAQHLAPELLEMAGRFLVQCDFHEHQQGGADGRRIEAGMVAGDDAVALHAFHPFDRGRDGQAHLLGQVLHRDPAIVLQDAQDLAVELVQGAHGLFLRSHEFFLFLTRYTVTTTSKQNLP